MPAVTVGQMVPGTIYQVNYVGSDGRALTAVVKHALTVAATQLRLLTLDGTITIDQPKVSAVATSAAVVLGVPH